MKTICVLLDGAGDRSYKELNGQTPLEFAQTPNLDKLAKQSQCGLMTVLGEGLSLGTDLAHFILFGYSPSEYPGRAVVDAQGENVRINDSDVVLRASFAEVENKDGFLLKERFTPKLSSEEIELLIEDLNCTIEDVAFRVVHSYDSHGFVILTGESLSAQVSDSDPFYAPQYVMKVEPFETDCKEAYETAGIINDFLYHSHQVLSRHPVNFIRSNKEMPLANMILTKWAGQRREIEPFTARNGMASEFIGKSKLLKGIAKLVGMKYRTYETFEAGLEMALHSESEYVHLHTKAPDEAAHQKDPFAKVRALEEIDATLEPLMAFEGLLIVTADHSTPCSGKMIHSGESVPFMARGQYIRKDKVENFNEIACSLGSLKLTGKDYMHYIQNATDRGNLYHLRAGKKRRNFRPEKVNRL